ncbi:MAG: hypothetical protein ACTSQV_06375, partial [Alphaproteobacteria bacterium]
GKNTSLIQIFFIYEGITPDTDMWPDQGLSTQGRTPSGLLKAIDGGGNRPVSAKISARAAPVPWP